LGGKGMSGRRRLGCWVFGLFVLVMVVAGSVSARGSAGPVGAGLGAPAWSGPPTSTDWQTGVSGQHARAGGRFWGIVPSGWGNELNAGVGASYRPRWQDFAGTSFAAAAPLSYHG